LGPFSSVTVKFTVGHRNSGCLKDRQINRNWRAWRDRGGGGRREEAMTELPVFDLQDYLLASGRSPPQHNGQENGSEKKMGEENRKAAGEAELSTELRELCEKVATCLRETGALVIRDPRCTIADNDAFLDMMEKFWGQTEEFKRKQERPEAHYQAGLLGNSSVVFAAGLRFDCLC
jgi:hypothetical protein